MTVRRLADGSWESIATREATEDMNLPKMLHQRVERHPGQFAIERRSNVGAWRKVTMESFLAEVDSIARGLIGIGLEPGDHLAILAPTSYEWALIDVATLSCGAITVPIYETDSAQQIAHILADADVRIVITATTQQAELVESVRTEGVRYVFSLDRGAERVLTSAARGVSVEQVRARTNAVTLSDEATIIYTSGTTGMPKGVVLTHGNFISPMLQAYDFLPVLINDPKSRSLLFLPVAHVLARFVMYCLLAGQGITAFSPDTRNLVDDIATFKPTMLLVGSSWTGHLSPWFLTFPSQGEYFSGVGDLFAALVLARFAEHASELPEPARASFEACVSRDASNIKLSPIARAVTLAVASLQHVLDGTRTAMEAEGQRLGIDPFVPAHLASVDDRVRIMRLRELRVIQNPGAFLHPSIHGRPRWLPL